jgi:hypothetical protein
MALDNSAVLKVGTGNFYTAPVDTALPLDILNPDPEWESMGHTSLDDILSSASEGGETTTLGSLQNPQLRTSTSARTESYTVNLLQFDDASLKLYYGSNAVVDIDGNVEIPQSPVASELAWLFVFRDGERVGGLYAPRVSILRADDFAITDTESLSRLSLRITPLGTDGASSALTFIPPKIIAPVTP